MPPYLWQPSAGRGRWGRTMGRQIPCRRIREGEREWTQRQELRLLVLALVGIRRVGRAAATAAAAAAATVLRHGAGAGGGDGGAKIAVAILRASSVMSWVDRHRHRRREFARGELVKVREIQPLRNHDDDGSNDKINDM
jgi:hypothetical protein